MRARFNKDGQAGMDPVYTPSTVQTRARILSKPPPQYTESARLAGVSGTVRVAAVLSATGRVAGIVVLNSLPNGLTRQAIDAAKHIRFVPAMVDGKPVSQSIVLE